MKKPQVLLLYRKGASEEMVRLVSACVPEDKFELVSWQRLNEDARVWMTKLQGYIEDQLCYRVIVLMHDTKGETNANVAFELGYSTGFQKGKLELNTSLGLPVGKTIAVACSTAIEAAGYPADLRQLSHATYEEDILTNNLSKTAFEGKLRAFLDLSRTEVLFILPNQVRAKAIKCNAIRENEGIAISNWVMAFTRNLHPEVADKNALDIVNSVLAFFDSSFAHLEAAKQSLDCDRFTRHKRFFEKLGEQFFGNDSIKQFRQSEQVGEHLLFLVTCIERSKLLTRVAPDAREDLALNFENILLDATDIFPTDSELSDAIKLIVQKIERLIDAENALAVKSNDCILSTASDMLLQSHTAFASKQNRNQKTEVVTSLADQITKFESLIERFNAAVVTTRNTVSESPFLASMERLLGSRCKKLGRNFKEEAKRFNILIQSIPSLSGLYAPDVLKNLSDEENELVGKEAGKFLTESPEAVKTLVDKIVAYGGGTRDLQKLVFVEDKLHSLLVSSWRETFGLWLLPSCNSDQIKASSQRFLDLGEMLDEVPASGKLFTSVVLQLNKFSRALHENTTYDEFNSALQSAIAGCRRELRKENFDRNLPTMFVYFSVSALAGMMFWFVISWFGGQFLASQFEKLDSIPEKSSLWRYLFNPSYKTRWNEVMLVGLGLGLALASSAILRYLFLSNRSKTRRVFMVFLAILFCSLLGWLPSNLTRGADRNDTVRALVTFMILCGFTAWLPALRLKMPTFSVAVALSVVIWIASFSLKLATVSGEQSSSSTLEVALGSGMIAFAFLLTRFALIIALKIQGAYALTIANESR